MEPNEETSETAVREVREEAGVVGILGRCLGVFEVRTKTRAAGSESNSPKFQNREHKHRTKVFVMTVTQELEDWDDRLQIGRKRQWFAIDEALNQLALHKVGSIN